MLINETVEAAREKAYEYLLNANIAITQQERENIEVADFGLGDLDTIGLQLVIYMNTERCCAKELVLFPNQICPEHRHPCFGVEAGKEETFRCRSGTIYLYVPGISQGTLKCKTPKRYSKYLTVWHQIILNPGEQYTLEPNTLHWFQAGKAGAVVSEFSTKSRDDSDVFTDPNINRATIISDL